MSSATQRLPLTELPNVGLRFARSFGYRPDVTDGKLVRFGVAMEAALLREFDELVESRGGTRSEALRDLARAAIVKAKTRRGAEAVATLTLVYDHHVRDLMERLTDLQHELGDRIRSTLHIHLDHNHCLEVIVMQGHSDHLQAVADRILALKGVKHAGLELYANLDESPKVKSPAAGHTHPHHGHGDDAHDAPHQHGPHRGDGLEGRQPPSRPRMLRAAAKAAPKRPSKSKAK